MTGPPAKARRTAPPAHLADTETARRIWCASLFESAGSVVQARSHRVGRRFAIDPHEHDRLIQFDLIDGCEGRVTVLGRDYPISRTTLMVTYPGERHGYVLTPGGRSCCVCHFKLRTDLPWQRLLRPPLPRLQTHLPVMEELAELLDSAAKTWTDRGAPAASVAQLAMGLCLWPVDAAEAGVGGASPWRGMEESVSRRLRRVMATLGERLDRPADLTELADAANLSPRHFARRFKEEFGCTPHAYLAARRLDAACARLMQPDQRIHQIAQELGFSSAAAFSRWFTHQAGRGPRAYQRDPRAF